MKYPTLRAPQSSRDMVQVFGGYNHNLRISDGEFFDMKNLTSDHYPILAPRAKRGVYASPKAPAGMIAKDSLCYVDGTNFVINEYPIDMGLSVAEEDCPKQLISMGAYVIILPDKKYINTKDLTDYGSIEAEFTTQASVSFTLCRVDGSEYGAEYVQATEPENPSNMALWVDTSAVPHSLKQWSESSGMWVAIATTYVKIISEGIGKAFRQYDGITISGLKDVDLIDSVSGEVIVEADQIKALDGNAAIWSIDDDFIVVVGILDITRTISNQITISRKMPLMDFVVESENRLWGCRYGTALNGQIVNELYACKLGDFKNWNCFMGVSTDSYAVSLGSDGVFTGAITYLGHPLFFKENCIHKVYGNFPANFQVQTTACRGVQKGSSQSLAIVNERVYYKAQHAVCAYDGSLPGEVSDALGQIRYDSAVAGAHGSKYYISMQDADGWNLFVFDAEKGLWHKEDNLHAMDFCSIGNEMYCIDAESKKILALLGSGKKEKAPVSWMAETGAIGLESPDSKYISRINLRLSLDVGARVRIFIQYDSMGGWEQACNIGGTSLHSFSIPIVPRRCDHFRLRILGEGDARLFAITKTTEQGSDRF